MKGVPLWRSGIIIVGMLLVIAISARIAGFFPSTINPDESIFVLTARELLHGHLPYEKVFDNKPVGSTMILAAAFKLFGANTFVTRLVGLLASWAAACLVVWLAAEQGWNRFQAIAAGALVIAFSTTMSGLATLTEILLAPFTVLSVLFACRFPAARTPMIRVVLSAAAGLACGLAIAIKIVPAAPSYAVFGTVVLGSVLDRRIVLLSAVACGIVFIIASSVPMGLAAGIYAVRGESALFYYSNFGFAGAYAAHHPGLGAVAGKLANVFDALWLLAGFAAVGAGHAIRQAWAERRISGFPMIILAWLIGELFAASASLQFYPHYFLNCIPPLALLATSAIWQLCAMVAGSRRSRHLVFAVLVGIACLVPIERSSIELLRDHVDGDVPRQLATAMVPQSNGERPTLFVTNYQLSALFNLADAAPPATRFMIAPHLLSGQSTMIPADARVEFANMLAARPDYLVTDSTVSMPAWASAPLEAVLSTDYRAVRSAGSATLYRYGSGERAQTQSKLAAS